MFPGINVPIMSQDTSPTETPPVLVHMATGAAVTEREYIEVESLSWKQMTSL